jgi:hypothetical protein
MSIHNASMHNSYLVEHGHNVSSGAPTMVNRCDQWWASIATSKKLRVYTTIATYFKKISKLL